MRVLHVSAYFAPAFGYGGPPRSIHGLCRALRARGVDATVYTTDANGPDALPRDVVAAREYEGVPVRYFPRSWPPVPLGSRALTGALRDALSRVDLLHIHGLWNRVVWAAAQEARRAAVPYVLSPRGMLEDAARSRRALPKRVGWTLIERGTVAGAALLHATSEREYQTLGRLCPGAELALIPNGVDLPPASVTARRPAIAFVGRLHAIKRLDLLVDAFRRLHASGRAVELVIAGPDEHGLRPALERRAAESAGRIVWLGAIGSAERQALLASSAALVLCSDSESFGMSVAEAMAAGLPVVVTRTCPWADVERHRAGFWVEQRPEAIADALARILDEPAVARELGARGRALVERKYQWDVVAEVMERQYARVVAAHAQRAVAV